MRVSSPVPILVPGKFWCILTFPGVMLHEMAHWLACRAFGLKVQEKRLFSYEAVKRLDQFSSSPVGWIVHEKPRTLWQTSVIVFAPLLVNTSVAVGLFVVAHVLLYSLGSLPLHFLFGWVGLSCAAQSFPSTSDARTLWRRANEAFLRGNVPAIVAYPAVLLIYAANVLSVIWFDLLYGILLYCLAGGVVERGT